ncbi:hypothetical protein H9P43_002319 [Blastocladiella emersonii ATCC 22665]|nr:hypothetical protein H9P43_002319 [Blastocladiella emersonii ATCC 22665]
MAPPNITPSATATAHRHASVATRRAAAASTDLPADDLAAAAPTAPYKRDRSRIWHWADIKDAVEVHGRIVFVYKTSVYDATAWSKTHPGGEMAMRHFNGKDVTDIIRVFHSPTTVKTKLPNFLAGHLHPDAAATTTVAPLILDPTLYPDEATYDASPLKPIMDHPELAPRGNVVHTLDHPEGVPVESKAFMLHTERVVSAYRALDQKLRDMDLYTTDMSLYWLNLAKFVVMLGSVFASVTQVIAPALQGQLDLAPWALWTTTVATAVMLGMFWHQIAFVAHDAGHISITGRYNVDWTIGFLLGNVFGGIGHSTHHLVTNHPEHDPDIQHLPFFAMTPLFFQNLWSSFHHRFMAFDAASRIFVRFQHILFYPVMMVARFNLYAQSYIFLLTNNDTNRSTKLEFAGLCVFWVWLTYLLSFLAARPAVLVTFVLISHAVTFLLHLQITLSHFAMNVHEVSPSESFPSRQLRTTMDVDCPTWLDWFHGGLQFQAVHHLFPRLPRTSFRAARPLVEQFARDTGLKYHLVPFIEGNGMVLSNFKEVARQVKIVFRHLPEDAAAALKDQ